MYTDSKTHCILWSPLLIVGVIREELPCEWRVLLRQPFPETRFYELGSDVGQRLGSIWALKTKYQYQCINVPTDMLPDSLGPRRKCTSWEVLQTSWLQSCARPEEHKETAPVRRQLNLNNVNFISTQKSKKSSAKVRLMSRMPLHRSTVGVMSSEVQL
jgi:hypothetical protein